ncbi:Stage II sporulation protein M [Caloramator mitchellensis]|uniref:Stage II sporulation protein M n=1 Tax=Caloramator mitchellensis TaxID=908809 RepID=A0A0R3K3B6_CALMK|nr:stage II sporulation protein M [Caloramator mitchellensis]KRQ86815.1 Stage II sporulation protein M [Caloramator mitchellensis]
MRRRGKIDLPYLFKNNTVIFLLVTFLFTIGIVIGALISKGMNYSDKQDLVVYLNNFFQIINKENVNLFVLFFNSLKSNLIIILLVWIISFTIFGSIIASIATIIKGITLGFTISFLLIGFGWRGFIFFLTGILPQNIFLIPGFLMICANSITYSIKSYKKSRYISNSGDFATYSISLVIFLLLILVGSFVESFISPAIVKGLSAYLTIQ